MDYGITEIVFYAIGSGVAFYFLFDFIWNVLPDSVLDRIDFKPFNCFVCFSGWLAIIAAAFSGFTLLAFISYVGFTALSSWWFNRQL